MGLIRGDARALPLRDGCVHCVVTSPPYWGLRDYGTAQWEGGDPTCGHAQEAPRFNGPKQTAAQVSGHASKAERHDRSHCPRCGAARRDRQLGLESTPEGFVAELVTVFREVWRVLKDDGTVWLNLGDLYAHGIPGGGCVFANGRTDGRITYEGDKARGREKVSTLAPGLKPKDLVGMPWRVAFALQADGWYLRSDIIWAKPNPMPESVTDRPTKAHEYVFLLSKQERYYYDADAIRESASWPRTNNPAWAEQRATTNARKGCGNRNAQSGGFTQWSAEDGRNARSVWTIPTQAVPEAHFATFPEALAERCILAGCPLGGLVFDPFCGTGTVLAVAARLGRRDVGVDLTYQDLAQVRTAQRGLRFAEASG